MPRSAWLALLLTGLVLAGCQNRPTGPQRAMRPKAYRQMVSLSPSTTELIGMFSDYTLLKGRTAADNFPEQLKSIEVVASVKPNYERIAEIKPDLVLYDAALFSPQDVEKIKSLTKADTFAISADTVDDFVKQMHELGSMLGYESRFNDYVLRIYSERDAARAEPVTPTPKVAVILPGSAGRDYIAGTKSFLASVVEASGGQIVGPEDNKFAPLNAEALIGWQPDLIIVSGTKKNMAGAIAVLNNPRYQALRAIKTKRVKVINEDVLVRRGARVDQLIQALYRSIAEGGAK